jgi:very-short-patch-repair endonuclease
MATTDKPKADDLLFEDLKREQMEPKREYEFHSYRNWRFDFAYPPLMLAIEVSGRGRHQTPKGYNEDAQKMNAAVESGWRVLNYPYSIVATKKRRERIIEQIKRIVCGISDEEEASIVISGD